MLVFGLQAEEHANTTWRGPNKLKPTNLEIRLKQWNTEYLITTVTMERQLLSLTPHALGFCKCHTVVYMWYGVFAVHMWSSVVFCPFACFLQSSSVWNSLSHRGFSVFLCPEGYLQWVLPLCGQMFYVLNKLCLLIHSSVNYQPYCRREDSFCFYLSEGLSILLLFHITSTLMFFTKRHNFASAEKKILPSVICNTCIKMSMMGIWLEKIWNKVVKG